MARQDIYDWYNTNRPWTDAQLILSATSATALTDTATPIVDMRGFRGTLVARTWYTAAATSGFVSAYGSYNGASYVLVSAVTLSAGEDYTTYIPINSNTYPNFSYFPYYKFINPGQRDGKVSAWILKEKRGQAGDYI